MAISHHSTLVDHVLPASTSRSSSLLRDGALVIGFSAFLALCAQASIHLPWLTPVPFTLQTLAVLLTGAALGSKRGALAMLAYLAEGALGLPVFAGGTGGFIQLLGFTGGYLWSYPIAAFVTGWLCERGLDRNLWTSVLAMLPGSLIIYALGVSWLAFWLPLAPLTALKVAFMQGMVPFIIGDTLKLVVAAALLPSAWAVLRMVNRADMTE